MVDTLDKLISRCPTVSTFERMAFRHYLAYSDTPFAADCRAGRRVATLRGGDIRAIGERAGDVSPRQMRQPGQVASGDGVLAYADPDAHVHIKPTTTRQLAARLGWTLAISRGPTSPPTSGCARWSAHFAPAARWRVMQNYITTQAVMY